MIHAIHLHLCRSCNYISSLKERKTSSWPSPAQWTVPRSPQHGRTDAKAAPLEYRTLSVAAANPLVGFEAEVAACRTRRPRFEKCQSPAHLPLPGSGTHRRLCLRRTSYRFGEEPVSVARYPL
ncbi:hypothetical protein AM571_CH03602 [Rhizobium etli 8C-3]|uniref:Uncharacterized protein n=1 Tax=Rhizobium etli 8C-3 TaxID=538025 RepID=A0A1L5P8L1_RHIET|nr:hypothetical protein AM571_CH03602 [Rhizobium etli 8C-3]